MTFPKTCPHCDAGPGPYVNSYLCGTYLRAGYDAEKHQTKRCMKRQIDKLESENQELRNRVAALESASAKAKSILRAIRAEMGGAR